VCPSETLVEDKMRTFKGEWAQFSFSKCPIYIHDGASAKISTNSHEIDNSVAVLAGLLLSCELLSLPAAGKPFVLKQPSLLKSRKACRVNL
jgi:hypothetical protein